MTENKSPQNVELDNELYDEDDEDTMLGRYLTFQVANEQYGIPIRHVTEIIGMQSITEVPELPDYVRGVINLRGQVIPVIDVRMRFGIGTREYDDRTCIVVVDLDGTQVGLIVDRVAEVLDIPDDDVAPPPTVHKGEAHRFVSGMGKVGDDVKILLDVGRMLCKDDFEHMSAGVTEASVS